MDDALAAAVGHILCSIRIHGPVLDEVERVRSNQPALYPVGTRKLAANAPRMRQVMQTGQPLLVQSIDEFRRSDPDHAGVTSLGCGSAVNTPVPWLGKSLGQVNLMHRPGWYTQFGLDVICALSRVLVPVFLTWQAT